MANGIDARWAFCVQICHDIDEQPVEGPTLEWDEQYYPFHRLVTLSVPASGSWQFRRVDEVNEKMGFVGRGGVEAHRSLGGINRGR